MRAAKLNETLEAAFMGVERDDTCTLHQAELIDHSPEREISDAEWLQAYDIDQAVDWREVPAAALEECGAAMSHATPTSWRFYLPAYLQRAVELCAADGDLASRERTASSHLLERLCGAGRLHT